jgi:hypothetical protein
MSILDALRVQQAENSSVRDLAMLPQAQIIKLAQMGQIPADVVPIIISEKARMSQQAAQMQASQSPTPPTVLEQAMAQNAQAEAPMNGVAAIPTQMFNEQNYATGGIVAFQGGGLADPTSVIYGGNEAEDAPAVASPAVGSLDAYIREAAARRAEVRKPSEAMLALERAMTDPSRFREARDEARNMALLQAGLGILGGSSQYALQNIGRGAAGAVDSYGQQMRDIRKQERESLGQRAALDIRKQEQALADIAAGESQYSAARKEALEERKIASREEIERRRAESAEKRAEVAAERAERVAELRNRGLIEAMQNRRDTDRAGFVADYVAGKRAEGDTRSEAVLRLEGQQQFNNQQARFGLAETQLQAQIIGQVNAEIARRRADPPPGDRAVLRAWKASGKSEDDYWAAEKERAMTSMYAELASRTGAPARPTTAAPSQGTPRAATQLTRGAARVSDAPRLRYNPQTDELE